MIQPFRPVIAALALSALVSAPALARRPAVAQGAVFSAQLVRADGSDAGYALIRGQAGGKELVVGLHGLTPGEHGLHIHAVGKCMGPDFASASGHLNPEGHQHGTLNPAGHHMGDLPNVTADGSGNASATIPLAIGDAELVRNLLDQDGSAIVVHAGPDDYKTDPSGKSGGRVACGVFRLDK